MPFPRMRETFRHPRECGDPESTGFPITNFGNDSTGHAEIKSRSKKTARPFSDIIRSGSRVMSPQNAKLICEELKRKVWLFFCGESSFVIPANAGIQWRLIEKNGYDFSEIITCKINRVAIMLSHTNTKLLWIPDHQFRE